MDAGTLDGIDDLDDHLPANPAQRGRELLPDAPTRRRRKRTNGRKVATEWTILIIAALTIALLIKAFLFQAFVIPSASMVPTLKIDDRILVNKLSYRLHDVHRGDVVVFTAPPGADQGDVDHLVKRVIGLPGERIEARADAIYIDGRALDEPYVNPNCAEPIATSGIAMRTQTIPAGQVFVMGDNRCESKDSRAFGPVPIDTIVGRAFVRIWPPTRIKFL